MDLSHLNPVVRRLLPQSPTVPTVPHERNVLVGIPNRLCLPVEKNPTQAPMMPDPVRQVIQHLDLECFAIQGPNLNLPLKLDHLNPHLRGHPFEQVDVLGPRKLCLPVAKNGNLPPPVIRRIIEQADIKMYGLPTGLPPINVNLQLRHLNPFLPTQPIIPVVAMAPRELGLPVRKHAVGVNKDLRNTTGLPANGVEILLQGDQSVVWHYDGPFATFNQSPAGTNTLLRWTQPAAPIQPGQIAHVGFTVLSAEAKILGIWWTQNGVRIGCARQIWSHPTATAGHIIYANSVLACESIPLFAGSFTVEWHATEVPLADLNATTPRNPIRRDVIQRSQPAASPG